MTLLAARGPTASQIAQVLQVSGLTPQTQAAGWATLDQDLATSSSKDHISLEDANSLWTQTGLPVEQSYLDAIENQFGAGVWQVDFDNDPDAAARAVDDWVRRATEGQIPTLLTPQDIPASTVFVILNAVYFEAQWAAQLLQTETGQFQTPSGPVPVTYMSAGGDDEQDASIGSGLDAVELPYWNGAQNERAPGRYRGNVPNADEWLTRSVRRNSRFIDPAPHHERTLGTARRPRDSLGQHLFDSRSLLDAQLDGDE